MLFDIVIMTRRDTRAAGLGSWLKCCGLGSLLSSLFRNVTDFRLSDWLGVLLCFMQ